MGPSISIDDWVPERPPKKPHLRTIPPPLPARTPSPIQVPSTDHEVESIHSCHKPSSSYDRLPTPDLPPPPPPPITSDEEVNPSDEPLPPPPPEIEWHLATAVPRRSTPISSGPASPQSPTQYSPTKDCLEHPETTKNSSKISQGMAHQKGTVLSLLQQANEPPKDAYEIQYDLDAINAIMESNRNAKEFPRRKSPVKVSHSKLSAMKESETCRTDDKNSFRSHIENRPPLPLPRDVQQTTDRNTQENCDHGESKWRKPAEKSTYRPNHPSEGKKSANLTLEYNASNSFTRNSPKPDNGIRASIKPLKSEMSNRSSLRYPSKKLVMNGHFGKERLSPEMCVNKVQGSFGQSEVEHLPPPVAPKSAKTLIKTVPESKKPQPVKKASDYESRIPVLDREGLSVFERRLSDEMLQDARKVAERGAHLQIKG